MKKRIFIAIHYMEIGGAERSLLGLLNSIDSSQYDVDLFIYQHTGEFMKLIPDKINLLPENKRYSTLERPMLEVLREGHVDIVIARLFARLRYRRFMAKNQLTESSSSFQYVANATTPLLPSLKIYGLYDLAISFLTPHNIVRDKVQARKKIAWIHTDYSNVKINALQELPVWNSYDNVVSISESVTKSFLHTFPLLKKKIVLIENILSEGFIEKQAGLNDVSDELGVDKGDVVLCSVGRFSYPKNFESIPHICKLLVDKGIRIKWFILGYGGDEEKIKKEINVTEMNKHVFILGKKENPYPYILACDIYVQPSRFEGKSVTVREAQILKKPIVITNYPTAASQLLNREEGLIVPMGNVKIADGIQEMIEDYDLRMCIIKNLESRKYSNEHEVKKIYNLI